MSKSQLVASVSFYGPNDQVATKGVVAILTKANKVEAIRKWNCATGDVREDALIRQEMVAFIKAHHVEHAITAEGISGCPHEAGIDYAMGQACPLCDFWKERNRSTPG